MPIVDLIISPDCPNVAAVREQLLRAYAAAGLAPRWHEWDSSDPGTPAELRRYGSPTILINGRELYGLKAAEADCCRVYENPEARGVPPLEDIVRALRAAGARELNE